MLFFRGASRVSVRVRVSRANVLLIPAESYMPKYGPKDNGGRDDVLQGHPIHIRGLLSVGDGGLWQVCVSAAPWCAERPHWWSMGHIAPALKSDPHRGTHSFTCPHHKHPQGIQTWQPIPTHSCLHSLFRSFGDLMEQLWTLSPGAAAGSKANLLPGPVRGLLGGSGPQAEALRQVAWPFWDSVSLSVKWASSHLPTGLLRGSKVKDVKALLQYSGVGEYSWGGGRVLNFPRSYLSADKEGTKSWIKLLTHKRATGNFIKRPLWAQWLIECGRLLGQGRNHSHLHLKSVVHKGVSVTHSTPPPELALLRCDVNGRKLLAGLPTLELRHWTA